MRTVSLGSARDHRGVTSPLGPRSIPGIEPSTLLSGARWSQLVCFGLVGSLSDRSRRLAFHCWNPRFSCDCVRPRDVLMCFHVLFFTICCGPFRVSRPISSGFRCQCHGTRRSITNCSTEPATLSFFPHDILLHSLYFSTFPRISPNQCISRAVHATILAPWARYVIKSNRYRAYRGTGCTSYKYNKPLYWLISTSIRHFVHCLIWYEVRLVSRDILN